MSDVSFIQMSDIEGKPVSVEKGQAKRVVAADPNAVAYIVNDAGFDKSGQLSVSLEKFKVHGPTLRAAVGQSGALAQQSGNKTLLYVGAGVVGIGLLWVLFRKKK